jgi:predicted alpha/beta hydrolase
MSATVSSRSAAATMQSFAVTHPTLLAADGYRLATTHYAPVGPVLGNLIVAGAIGVSQRFYRRFAEFAAARGFSTLTFDYRGIGCSAPPTLRGFYVDFFDWGKLDLAAAVEAMGGSRTPLYIVAHSFGGHALGMLPNHHKVRRACAFGTGSGWHGWMPPLERLRVLALWHLVGPVLTTWKGYLPWSLLGMGEDLPLDIYRQWKRWCRNPNYFFGDPGTGPATRGFAEVRMPIMAVSSTDDRWSPPRSRDAFMAGYSNARLQRCDIDPAQLGLAPIGHLGYFRDAGRPLWSAALSWLHPNIEPAVPGAQFAPLPPGEQCATRPGTDHVLAPQCAPTGVDQLALDTEPGWLAT